MSSCASIDTLVTPYIDNELSPAERQTVEQHIGRCPLCRSRVAAERGVRELLSERKPTLTSSCAPAILRRQCAMAANDVWPAAGDSSPRAPWRLRLAPVAAAASLVVIVGGAFVYQATESSSRIMAAELAADHVKCFAMNAVLGTKHSADAVQSSMASGFGWSMTLPAGAEREGLELVGSRPCLYGEGKIAHIMYRHNGHPVSLFMLPRSERPEQTVQVLGHQCAIWSAGDRTFVLVAREAQSEVQRLATYVHTTLQ